EIEIITPIRDKKLSRQEEIEYLKGNSVDINWEKAKYSVNKGLWGTSVGGAETLTSEKPLPESAYPSQLQEQEPKQIYLGFTKGELTSVNGTENSPEKNIEILENIASKFAIGRDIHVGDTIIGIKGRVGFEAAAALITIKAHHLLEKHTLSKWQLQHKDYIANWYGMHLHEGLYLDPVMRDFEAFLQSSQEQVSGTVFLTLHPYRFVLDGIESKFDLMNSGFGKYGEENNAWTANDAKGFIKILSNSGKIYQHVKQEL
ncbi:MAG: argininosuccinate synthase, partial [Salinimicrobium sediminis]|nr:argininosuccinate synthase [Salinimicrobium sediminis]